MTTPTNNALEALRNFVELHRGNHDLSPEGRAYAKLLDAAIAALSSELSQQAEVGKDAERYRWLRDQADFMRVKEGSPQVCLTDEWGEIISTLPSAYPRGEKLDAAIDAAIAQQGAPR